MSLLGNLITQVAKSAMDPEDSQQNPINQRLNPRRTGGLGDVLGSVLGGSNQGYNPQQYNRVDPNQLGLDDLLGGLMGGGGLGSVLGGGLQGSRGQGGMGTGGLGSILGSVLGGQQRRSGFGGKGMLVAALMPLVLSWIQRNGGLSGALGKLSNLGFGNQTQSWMSTQDANDNVDPNEIDKIFDHNEIMQIAQMGILF